MTGYTRTATDKAALFLHAWNVLAPNMPKPKAEFFFDRHIGRRHHFDFAFPDKKIAVEIEGNAWHVKGGGKHMQDADLEKYNIASMLGWRVFRLSPAMVKNDPTKHIGMILEAMDYDSNN